MKDLEKLFPTDLYHSYVVEGDPNTLASHLLGFFENRGDITPQSPDVLFKKYDSFSIDDAKEIKEWHSQMCLSDGNKFCIIGTKFINREAEQTFLKLLEDSTNTNFFLVIPDASALSDTIISRSHVVKPFKGIDEGIEKTVNEFLKSSPADRINMISKIIEQYKDKENSGGIRYFAIEFINQIEKVFYQKFKSNKNDKEVKFVLNELSKSRNYLSTPGASVKMILENIAIVI